MKAHSFTRNDVYQVESVLMSDPVVHDCAVLARKHKEPGEELIAYIVSASSFSPEGIQDRLRTILPARLLPTGYVPVSSLPHTAGGLVDERALQQLEVIDDDLMRRWEERLHDLPGVEEVAVIARERVHAPSPLDLSEILPESVVPLLRISPEPAASRPQNVRQHAMKPRSPAIGDGGSLAIDEDAPKTLAEALLRTASKHGDKGIRYVQPDRSETFQSYAVLLAEAMRILTGLTAEGLKPRDPVILQIDNLREYFPVLWACILGGIASATVAVPLRYDEKSSIVTKIFHTWETLERPPIIASAHLTGMLSGLKAVLPMHNLKTIPVDALRDSAPSATIYRSRPDDTAFFQLTSGSTGTSKCIQETHRSIIAHIHAAQRFNGYQSTDVSLNWLPMDHVVPLLTFHLKDSYLGCQQVQVPTETILADPLLWLDAVERHGVTHTWSPNFGYKLVNDRLMKAKDKSRNLSSIKFFMNAGEQVTLPVVRDFLRLTAPFGVQASAMQPAFGMAEAATCITYRNDFTLETAAQPLGAAAFVELGPPVPGVEIRIADGENRLLPEGEAGRLQIKGDVVMPGYFNNPEANREGFVGGGWFNTGDLGFIRNGRLTITGREKEMIIIRGVNYYCHEIEDLVAGLAGVAPTYAAACAIDNPECGTEDLAIFFTPASDDVEESAKTIKNIRSTLAANLGISPTYVVPVEKPDFPKTTSGKIQRGRLKEALQRGDLRDAVGSANGDTLPDWFYRKIWRQRRSSPLASDLPHGLYVIFLDRLGLGRLLKTELRRYGRSAVSVQAGTEFRRLARRRYRINPQEPAHYDRLLASVAHDLEPVSNVLHLWTYEPPGAEPSSAEELEHSQDNGAYSLLFLIQGLAKTRAPDRQVGLFVVSSHTQATSPLDSIAYARAPLLGLCSTIPQEINWIRPRHIDLPMGSETSSVAAIFQELRSVRDERQVAYRNGKRLVPRLKKVDLGQEPQCELPFRPGGLYLIAGGLGGIGTTIAKHLLQNYQARLLLTGRSVLPPDSEWPNHLDSGSAQARRIEAYAALQRLGGEVIYETVDLCDRAGLRRAVERAEAHWGCRLDGVIHCAGVFEERPLLEERRATMAATLRPKLQGSWAVHELIKDRRPAVAIYFSSVVNGFFGGAMAGAYAAANSFVETFSHQQRTIHALRSFCFSSSMWDEVGLSSGYRMKELFRARGYELMTAEQGLNSLLAGLSRGQTAIIAGLDGENRYIRGHVEKPVSAIRKLVAYCSGAASPSLRQLADRPIFDRFGAPSFCETVPIGQMPRTADGAIDRRRLLAQVDSPPPTDNALPEDALEKRLALIWKEILGLPEIRLSDNFLELGGDSLRATQIVSRLSETFPVQLSLRRFLLECPTVGALAEVVEEMLIERLNRLPESEAAELLDRP